MGKLVLAGVHPEGTPLGEFCDALWAAYVDFSMRATPEAAEAIDEHWARITGGEVPAPREVAVDGEAQQRPPSSPSRPRSSALPVTEDGVPPWRKEGRPPTPEEIAAWSGGAAAQRGQQTLMAMAGGTPGSSSGGAPRTGRGG